MIRFLFLLLISLNFTIASSNKRYGAGLDIGSKGSGIFFNYLSGNAEKNFDFVSEIITCIKDKDKKIVSGDPEKIKKIYDTWVFSRDTTSANPNWQLVDTLT